MPGVGTAAASTGSLTGWLSSGASFPERALVLVPPSGANVTAATVHVTENGKPVHGVTVTPSATAGPGDFGLEMLIDQGASMKGAGLRAAISGTRALAGLRTAQQELGVIGFAHRANVLAPLSTDTTKVEQALSSSPSTGSGANAPAAIQLALSELRRARVALGAIVVVSDGVGELAPGTAGAGSIQSQAASATVQSEAASAQVPIFTVGLKDQAATATSLSALAKAAPGQFLTTPSSGLSVVLKEIDSRVTGGDVVRWRSASRPGQTVTVGARVNGTPGLVSASYIVAGAPARAAGRRRALSHPARRPRSASRLSAIPSFALPRPGVGLSPAPATAAPASFWSSPAATPAVAGLVGLILALALAPLLYRPSKRDVRVRVGSFNPATAGVESDSLLSPAAPKQSMLERTRWWPPFLLDVEIAHSPHSAVYLVKRAAVIAVVLAVVIVLASGSTLLALVALLGWPFALRQAMKRKAGKAREKFRETLPGYLQDLASAMRVGRSFIGAMTVVADSAEEPTKSELERVVTDEALGRNVDEALEAVARRMDAPDLDQIALIAALNRRSGSNVAEALDRVAEGARERADLKREVKALTAQAKMSSLVLTSLPGVLLLGLMLISPLYAHPLFHTTLGIALLGVGACMVFAGWKVMQKITNVKV